MNPRFEADRIRDAPIIEAIRLYLMGELQAWGPYVVKVAETGSIYMKFPHWALGSIRIGNHPGIERYKFKWSVRIDFGIYDSNLPEYPRTFGKHEMVRLISAFLYNADERGILPGDRQTWEEYKGLPVTKRKQTLYNAEKRGTHESARR